MPMGTAECRLCGKTIEGNVPDYQAGRSFLGTGSDVHFRSDEITWKLAHDLMEHHSRCEKRTKENNAVDFDVYLVNRSTLVGLSRFILTLLNFIIFLTVSPKDVSSFCINVLIH